MKKNVLPDEFKNLERFSEWALPHEEQRNSKRLSSTMEEIKEFYDVLLAEVGAIFIYLDRFDIQTLGTAERNLLNMTLALAEVSNAVEVFKSQPGVIDGFPSNRFAPINRA